MSLNIILINFTHWLVSMHTTTPPTVIEANRNYALVTLLETERIPLVCYFIIFKAAHFVYL